MGLYIDLLLGYKYPIACLKYDKLMYDYEKTKDISLLCFQKVCNFESIFFFLEVQNMMSETISSL